MALAAGKPVKTVRLLHLFALLSIARASSVISREHIIAAPAVAQGGPSDDGLVEPGYMTDTCIDLGDQMLIQGAPHCHLQLEGFNAEMDLLRGGLDGLYLLRDCHNGKPLYTRAFEDTSEPRTIWFNDQRGEWCVSASEGPAEDELVAWAEEGVISPLLAAWHLDSAFNNVQKQQMESEGQAEELLYFQSDSGSITCMPEEPGSDPSEPWQQAAGAGGGSEGDGLEQQEGEGWDWSDDPSWPEDDLVEGQRAA